MKDKLVTTLTERGQTSIPARLREAGLLRPGARLRWERISDRVFRVAVMDEEPIEGPAAMRGILVRGKRRPRRRTDEVLHELREGDAD